jgi:hypothetical protein
MPGFFQRMFRVSAIGGTSFTLTPVLGPGTAGALVDGGFPQGDRDIASGITSIVVNSTGTPDTAYARVLNSLVKVSIETA